MRSFTLIIVFTLTFFKQSLGYESNDISEIKPSKRSIYRDSGIFHNGISEIKNEVTNLRHSGKKVDSFERIVFDFKEDGVPQVYAHIDSKNNKLQVDFLRTNLSRSLKPKFKSHRVREINFFPLANNVLSTEILLKKNTYVEIFTLKKPSRLVIDFKN